MESELLEKGTPETRQMAQTLRSLVRAWKAGGGAREVVDVDDVVLVDEGPVLVREARRSSEGNRKKKRKFDEAFTEEFELAWDWSGRVRHSTEQIRKHRKE
jgi:hypothetical protein